MCGIIGYVGTRDVVPVLIGGLKKLEYRGYDSAGIAVVNGSAVEVVPAKHGPPLVVGLGENENIIASDVAPLLAYTRNIIYLEDGEYAVVDQQKVEVFDKNDRLVERPPKKILWDAVMAEKEGYRHYMLKEIHEQPRAVRDTFNGRMFEESGDIYFNDLELTKEKWKQIERVHVVACGTSWHAGLVGKFLLEDAARIPIEVDYGSEYRYRNPIVDEHTLVIGVTQSGQTADTIAGMQEAKAKGAKLFTICNVIGADATRMSHGTIYTNAGPEIGVASTKAFTTQLTAFYLLSLYIRALRGESHEVLREGMHEMRMIPHKIEHILKHQEKHIEALAHKYHRSQDFLFLGRGVHYPIALEGALKLKEISYIHAEGYPAGEMKHGPIALIDENMPVVAVATRSPVYDKVVSNLQEVKARDGKLIVICDEGDEAMMKFADDVIEIPSTIQPLQPILSVIPTQLLAYYIALRRGCDVDQPRNLAKSVTVE